MDIRFLESLIAVIETGSIAAAARRENLTAPAISQRIQALERSLSCELLNRAAHSVGPTEQCLVLLPSIRALIQGCAQLHDELDAGGLSGDLRLGAVSTALTGILPQVMEQLLVAAPRLRLRITPGDSRNLYEQVVAGELDAGIMVRPPFALPKTLTLEVLRRESLMILTKAPVEPGEIASTILSHPLISYDTNAWGGQIAQQYLQDHQLQPDVLCNLDALEAISLMVAKGMGVSLVPAWAGLKTDDVYATPTSHTNAYQREIVLLHRSTPRRPQALKVLNNLLMQTCRESETPGEPDR